MLDGKTPFAYPPSLATCVQKVLRGEYDYPSGIPDHPPVRRVLDIGANVAAFACWAFKRFGHQVYIDCYEPNPDAARVCAMNMPPGAKVHQVAVTTDPGPVELHIGSDWGFSSLDPTLNPRSGEVVEVPALHPNDLPAADLLKVDGEGIELEVLRHYSHLRTVGVVMFEWHRESDRMSLEELCAAAGLRLFKSVHDCVSLGQQVWVRSQAINGPGRYIMPMPR